jgi:WD40 repeat protein
VVVVFLLIAATTAASGGREPRVSKVSSIPAKWDNAHVLLDVCPNGLALLVSRGQPGEAGSFDLWDLDRGKPAFTVTVAASDEHKSIISSLSDCVFRCLDGGKRVVALQPPELVMMEAQRPQDVRWALPSRDFLGPPLLLMSRSRGAGYIIQAGLAVSPSGDLLAAAYNMGKKPSIFLYTADLKRLVRTWELSQLVLVQDICWSPDGKRLAVLYSGEVDAKGNYVGDNPHFHPLGIPDVEVLDPQSGERQLRFFSGDREAKVAFSPDGTRLFTISLRDQSTSLRGDIRIFSASNGKLLKKITSGRFHLHNNFALSPDGRLIVADASGRPPWLPWLQGMLRYGEGAYYNKTARFVVLDVKTGRVVFEHHEVTPGPPDVMHPVVFAFTPDSRRLLVDPNFANCGLGEHVDVYSIDDRR